MKRLISSSLLVGMSMVANAQSCNPNIPITRPDSRYEVLTNGTEIKDTQSGLIWQRCSIGQSWDGTNCSGSSTHYNWQQALEQANTLGNGYRLPNIKELQTLSEVACHSPAINVRLFPNVPKENYWSSSPTSTILGRGGDDDAWVWSAYQGSVFESAKNRNASIRAVRDSH